MVRYADRTWTFRHPDRDELRRLLSRWQHGEITFYQAVEEAEAMEDRLWADIDVIEFPPNDPREVATEVLCLLSMGYVHPLFVEEIPALLEYLDAPLGSEAKAAERLVVALSRLEDAERLRQPRIFTNLVESPANCCQHLSAARLPRPGLKPLSRS